MTSTAMVARKKAELVTRADVAFVRTPDATTSWYPIPHDRLIADTLDRLQGTGFNIVDERHMLTADGDRYFGTFGLQDNRAEDYRLEIGLRNSHDMAFAAGLLVGSRVFVCDNLAFNAEIKLARKHTRWILSDLPGLLDRAVGQLGNQRDRMDARIEAYKVRELSDPAAHDFFIRCLDAKVISVTSLRDTLGAWRKPLHETFLPRTIWSAFNAVTEVLKGRSMMDTPRRTMALHGVADLATGFGLN